jgi:hypothetical protein
MHTVSKDGNGALTITSKQLDPKPVKLKEATDSKPATSGTSSKTEKPKNGISDLDHKILSALDSLGGKDIDSMTLAKKVGTTRTHPDAPRAPIRNAMQAFEKLGYVKAEKKGAKYLFSITDKGKTALTNPPVKEVKDKKHDPDDVPDHMLNEAHKAKQAKEAGSVPASTNERPANTDIECPKCRTFNPYMAEFCKECGSVLKPVRAAPVAA